MQPEPLARQEVDHIDVGPFHQGREARAGGAANLRGLDLGTAVDLVVHGGDPEPIVQPRQRRLVPGLPQPPQSDDPDPEPNLIQPSQARLLAIPAHELHACRLADTSRLTPYGFEGYPDRHPRTAVSFPVHSRGKSRVKRLRRQYHNPWSSPGPGTGSSQIGR